MDSLTWLLATGNQGKIAELKRILAAYPIRVVGLADLDLAADSPETGTTFLANAKQKAVYYRAKSGLPTLADDSGLVVDALDGAPGIYSSRFGGFPTHSEKSAFLLGRLHGLPFAQRTARFQCAAVFDDGSQLHHAEGSLEGFIGESPRGDGGFGYDPVFWLGAEGPSLAEIPMAEKNRLSHRAKAFGSLIPTLLSQPQDPA